MFENEYSYLLEGLFEGAYIVDRNRKITFWNKGSEEITGYKAEEVINSHCYNKILQHVDKEGNELCFNGCPLHKTLATGVKQESDVFLHHKEGHRVPVKIRSFPIYDENNNITAAIEVFNDLNFKKDIYNENRKLQQLLITDELTKVYNRRYLDYQLQVAINEFSEFNQKFGIIFIDIDDFKFVNDTYGHNVGDEVLKMVSNSIKSNLRSNDMLGRWGGEEFIVISKVVDKKDLGKLAEKLRILVEKSTLKYQDTTIKVTISLGGAMIVDDDKESLVDRADKAMYESKETGKNKYTIK